MSEIKIINAKKIYHDVPVIENLNITIPKLRYFPTFDCPRQRCFWSYAKEGSKRRIDSTDQQVS